jgi:hypothetical protein
VSDSLVELRFGNLATPSHGALAGLATGSHPRDPQKLIPTIGPPALIDFDALGILEPELDRWPGRNGWGGSGMPSRRHRLRAPSHGAGYRIPQMRS